MEGKRRRKAMRIYGTAALLMLAAVLLGVREAGTVQAAQAAAEEKVVYLTFDDGPSCRTEELLAVLEEKGVQATFFVTAEQEEYLPWIGRIAAAGHAVGAHCYRHDTNRLYGSFDAFREDLEKICALIEEQTGQSPVLYRFPGGSRSTLLPGWLRAKALPLLEQRGMVYFDWNAVSGDDTPTVYSAQTLVQNILRDAGGEPVIVPLFHDFSVAKTTPEAAGLLIDTLREQGYRFDILTGEVQMQFP